MVVGRPKDAGFKKYNTQDEGLFNSIEVTDNPEII